MKTFKQTACIAGFTALISASAAASAMAQDAPAAQEEAVAAEEAPASSEEWVQFSNNERTIYLIDLKSFGAVEDTAPVRIARVPTSGGTSVFSYRIDEYEMKCRGNQARMMAEVEFDDTGNEVDRYPEADAEWETMRPASLPAYFKAIVCEGARPRHSSAPSIKAFIERGRQ